MRTYHMSLNERYYLKKLSDLGYHFSTGKFNISQLSMIYYVASNGLAVHDMSYPGIQTDIMQETLYNDNLDLYQYLDLKEITMWNLSNLNVDSYLHLGVNSKELQILRSELMCS